MKETPALGFSRDQLTEAELCASDFRIRVDKAWGNVRTAEAGLSHADAMKPANQRVALCVNGLHCNGANNFALWLAQALLARGNYECVVYAPSDGALRERFLDAGVEVVVADACCEADLAAELAQYDAVLVNTLLRADAEHAARRAGVPHALVIHEHWTDAELEHYAASVYGWNDLRADYIKKSVEQSDEVVFVASAQKSCYRNLLDVRAESGNAQTHRVIYNGLPTETIDLFLQQAARPDTDIRKHLGYGSEDLIVVQLGSICNRKNQRLTLEAFLDLRARRPDLRPHLKLLLVGARDRREAEVKYVQELKRRVDETGAEDAVQIMDLLDNPLPELYIADVVSLPSYNEALPLTLCEAMAFGKPIVASRVSGIPESFEDGKEGLLIDDPAADDGAARDQLTRAFETLLANPVTRSRMGELGKQRVARQFTRERMGADYDGLITKMIAARRDPAMGRSEATSAIAAPPSAGHERKGFILVDMDNTLVDFDEQFTLRFEKALAEQEVSPETVSSLREALRGRRHFDIEDNLPEAYRKLALDIVAQEQFFSSLSPRPGAIEALREMIRDGYRVALCTSVHPANRRCTDEKMKWVKEHCVDLPISLYVTQDKTLVRGDVLIDDNPAVHGSRDATWRQVLFDLPYNRDLAMPRLQDWRRWSEVVEGLD